MKETKWERVRRSEPCGICLKCDWCTYSTDLKVYCCMRVQSDRPAKNGGWLHPFDGVKLPVMTRKSERAQKPLPDLRTMLCAWQRLSVGTRHISVLAAKLGVSEDSLKMLGCSATDQFKVWAFPMFAGDGAVIGVRMRHENGRKWTLLGSHNGLFLPACLPTPDCVVCEGPTDAAAALTMGLFAIGRPSCSGGVDHLIAAINRLNVRRVTIIADVDQDRTDDNGRDFNPGIDGSRRLAELLPVYSRIVTLPAKDLRSFVQAGGSATTFQSIAKQLVWNKPK